MNTSTARYFDPARPTRHGRRKAALLAEGVRALAGDGDPTLETFLEPGRIGEVVIADPHGATRFLAIRRSPVACDRIEAALARHGRPPVLSIILGAVASGEIAPAVAELLSDAALDFAAGIPGADDAGILARGLDVVLVIGTADRERWAAQWPLRGELPALGPGDPAPGAKRRKAAKRA